MTLPPDHPFEILAVRQKLEQERAAEVERPWGPDSTAMFSIGIALEFIGIVQRDAFWVGVFCVVLACGFAIYDLILMLRRLQVVRRHCKEIDEFRIAADHRFELERLKRNLGPGFVVELPVRRIH